jgi:hypothetical protein
MCVYVWVSMREWAKTCRIEYWDVHQQQYVLFAWIPYSSFIHTCINTHMHTYIRACMHIYINTYIHTHVYDTAHGHIAYRKHQFLVHAMRFTRCALATFISFVTFAQRLGSPRFIMAPMVDQSELVGIVAYTPRSHARIFLRKPCSSAYIGTIQSQCSQAFRLLVRKNNAQLCFTQVRSYALEFQR